MALRTWLAGMEKCFLKQAFDADPTLSEEAAQFRALRGLSAHGKALGHLTVSTFSNHGRDPGRLFLTTLYSAKGLECNAVIMPGLEHGQVPRADNNAEQQAEARRLFYVGLTRARHQVHLMYATTPSVFVEAVQDSLGEAGESA
ncbi:ATP-binding domain-containing protein [Luteibacter aegosomaticola]|uniref:3'-5' exonuclease n=1 Tax=Luteibacter aegosomaticola TaxID=2911538 RepID=UPI001FF80C7A|nr:3'-5' exonuclease [Luteibacter aegosomaticola]UPG88330.1 ATP-binding domain-containing protein [Luteibacter aegosomaticola]